MSGATTRGSIVESAFVRPIARAATFSRKGPPQGEGQGSIEAGVDGRRACGKLTLSAAAPIAGQVKDEGCTLVRQSGTQ